jgi:predicted short-subunit dehydrogenase-like oxidoreductase (DUF2520 family)
VSTAVPCTRLGIVGLGAVGRSFAAVLAAAGVELRLWSRSFERRGLAQVAHGTAVVDDLAPLVAQSDALLLTVADGALPEVAERVAALGPGRGRPALHCAGSLPVAVLEPLRAAGYAVGLLHPVAPVAEGRAESLRGAWFGLAGEPRALDLGRFLVAACGGSALDLDLRAPGAQARYHGACALLSGGAVGLFARACAELAAVCGDGAAVRGAAQSLLRRTADNLARGEPQRVVTGPLARGDVERVARHLEALGPPARELYRLLGAELLALLRDDLEPARVAALERLLGEGP